MGTEHFPAEERDRALSGRGKGQSTFRPRKGTERSSPHADGRMMEPFRLTDGIEVRDRAPLFLIGGPCVIESRAHVDFMCGRIREVCSRLGVPFVFKASFDKANRSSGASFRGPGAEEGAE